jgi:hypothetical protein
MVVLRAAGYFFFQVDVGMILKTIVAALWALGGAGRIPGLRAGAYVPPDGTAVNANAILLVTGAALIGIGIAV